MKSPNSEYLKLRLKNVAISNHIYKELIIAWDEIDIQSRLIYSKNHDKIVDYVNNISRNRSNTIPEIEEITKKITQFFVISLDGKFSLPILFRSYDNFNVQQFLIQYYNNIKKLIKDNSSDNYDFKIIGVSSDGVIRNLLFIKKMAKIKKSFFYFEDFSHILKRLRNTLLNQFLVKYNQKKSPIQFNIDLLTEY